VCHFSSAPSDYARTAFGAKESNISDFSDGRIMHAELKIGDALFFVNDSFSEV
jgi:uncharacterized glyoxalase superfamily protein PhnB